MDRNKLMLRVDGTVTPRKLAEILCRLQDLLDALAEEIAPETSIRWSIETNDGHAPQALADEAIYI